MSRYTRDTCVQIRSSVGKSYMCQQSRHANGRLAAERDAKHPRLRHSLCRSSLTDHNLRYEGKEVQIPERVGHQLEGLSCLSGRLRE